MEIEDRDEWLQTGIDRRWIGPVFCYVHDYPELTEHEQSAVDDNDGDPDAICVFVTRLMP